MRCERPLRGELRQDRAAGCFFRFGDVSFFSVTCVWSVAPFLGFCVPSSLVLPFVYTLLVWVSPCRNPAPHGMFLRFMPCLVSIFVLFVPSLPLIVLFPLCYSLSLSPYSISSLASASSHQNAQVIIVSGSLLGHKSIDVWLIMFLIFV